MTAGRLVIAHPSADVYGSDLQLLHTITAMVDAGWQVRTVVPADGPLVPLLKDHGSAVQITGFPVLRKALLTPTGIPKVGYGIVHNAWRISRWLRRSHVDRVLVNTLTIPEWVLAAKLAGVGAVVHVHEAEDGVHPLLRLGLATPLLAADRIIANSAAARSALALPVLRARTTVVHNGLPGPEDAGAPDEDGGRALDGNGAPEPDGAPLLGRAAGGPARIALIARLSPRKGNDVALEALALLRAEGRDVHLDMCGTVFAGYEWFEQQLNARAAEADLAGAVNFLGYVNPTWDVLAAADVVIVPSRTEPFGNTAVEALLAGRPLVASAVQGLQEVVRDGETGVLVPPGDAAALAHAIGALLDDPVRAAALAAAGRADALDRFSPQRYRVDVLKVIAE